MKKQKLVSLGLIAMLALGIMGCGNEGKNTAAAKNDGIVVISREDGSGTRGAFVELFGIEKKDANGKKVDLTTENAAITNSTAVMLTTVKGNKNAIGYISLGSLNDSVKALKIDGVEASATNVKSGAYKIYRPFNVVTTGNTKLAAQDFINYIMSKEGQAVVAKHGYIGNEKADAYLGIDVEGKVVVAGSSSVTPIMEKLKEAYQKVNGKVKVEVQQSDSTTGIKATIKGLCDIGMASRNLKQSEVDKGLHNFKIANDGIAVIVNKENKIDNLSKANVADIFTGKVKTWQEF